VLVRLRILFALCFFLECVISECGVFAFKIAKKGAPDTINPNFGQNICDSISSSSWWRPYHRVPSLDPVIRELFCRCPLTEL
jgi:hypothetical protein